MAKVWRIHDHDAARIAALGREAGISPIVAHLLLARGIDRLEQIRGFLDCKLTDLRDPDLLPGVTEAVERLSAAVAERKKITIYGDYVVDGMTAVAMLVECLRLLGADVNYFVPRRLEEGYGLNSEALRTLAAQGRQVVVSVDCGIAAVAEAD